MKKVLGVFFGLAMLLSFENVPNVEASVPVACNPGHESTGVQYWGTGKSLKCDKSTTAVCCFS